MHRIAAINGYIDISIIPYITCSIGDKVSITYKLLGLHFSPRPTIISLNQAPRTTLNIFLFHNSLSDNIAMGSVVLPHLVTGWHVGEWASTCTCARG